MKTPHVMSSSKSTQALVLAALAAIGLATSARAQTRTWVTATPTGNWSDTTKWVGGNVPDTTAENASFPADTVGRTVTLDGDFAIGSLTIVPRTAGFSGLAFTLQLPTTPVGNEILRINAGVSIDSGNTVAINVPIEVTASQTWTGLTANPAGNATFSGVISGIGQITRTASSTSVFTFSGANTFSGGFVNAAQTTRLGASSTISGGIATDGPLGTGTVTLNAGTLASNGATARSLSNNIVIGGTVNLGNSSQTGTLTFSDAGLTTASTFTLGSATNGNVSILRAGGTNLIFDQAIAQSGGVGQSVNFASTSGTPAVTINRTKTATGNILVGGTALVLNNGAANSGSLIGVNGSITATGGNKFSSGSLISDNTALIATDASNYSAVSSGKATVYNNGRVSFATDQTQATVAGLYTADSQVRLGLGSGSTSTTTTENYDQSAIGNGKASLVSASTGTVTYNGTLSSGSDNTYRVGGGAGTLALGNALTSTGKSVSFEGGGTVTSTNNNTYDGTTTLNATTVTISGTAGALSGTSAITINNSGSLNLTNTTALVNASRVGDSVGLTLNNGLFALNGTSTTAASETVGNLSINSGRNFITIATTPAAATVKTLQFGTLTRANNALAIFRGDSLGGTGTARNEIKFSSAPTLIGGGGAAGTTNISVLPWARGATASGNQATGLVTYEANGIRQLTTAEYVAASGTSAIDVAVGVNTDRNVRITSATLTGTTQVNTINATPTVNALLIDNTGATNATTFSLNAGTVNVTSGAVHINQTAGQNFTLNNGTLAFGTTEGVITANTGGFLTTLTTFLTGSGGVSIYNVNTGGISVGATNAFTGGLTIGGNGYVGVDQDGRLGAAGGSVTHAGGELRFFSAFTTTRGLTLLGNVGNNTLGNNAATVGTINWNGNITGAGLLRLVNNATTVGTAGFSLGGSNDYSGGTQIEGIAVTGSSNTALGTGTVTLIGANNNAAALTLTGTAPTLGGLRGTDGTVTINPTASAATLTVGSNNENTVFNGIIGQGGGKTGSLTKSGTGTLVLGGSSTYTGTTTVDAGKLLVNGSLASTAVSVTNGAILGGSGYITGSVSVDGTIAAGNSIGTLNTGTLNLNSGSTFALEINITATNAVTTDLVNVAGDLNLSGSPTLNLVNLGTNIALDLGTVITFVDYSGTWNGNTFAGLADDSQFTLGANTYQISYNGINGTDTALVLQTVAVPEPSTYAMILGGFGLLIGFQKLRRKSMEG